MKTTKTTKTTKLTKKETRAEILQELKKLSMEEIAEVVQNLEQKCITATLTKQAEALPEGDNYALFVWQPNLPPMRSLMDIFGGGDPRGGDELSGVPTVKDYGRSLMFVKMAKDVKELDAIIRREPQHKYVMMRGKMMNVSSMTQVFVDGKTLNTLEQEWA